MAKFKRHDPRNKKANRHKRAAKFFGCSKVKECLDTSQLRYQPSA